MEGRGFMSSKMLHQGGNFHNQYPDRTKHSPNIGRHHTNGTNDNPSNNQTLLMVAQALGNLQNEPANRHGVPLAMTNGNILGRETLNLVGNNQNNVEYYEVQKRDNIISQQQHRIVELEHETQIYKKLIENLMQQIQPPMMNPSVVDPRNSNSPSINVVASKQLAGLPSKFLTTQNRYWSADEHQRFLDALEKYGQKNVKAISIYVGTRNATQVRTHSQKYFLKLEKKRQKGGKSDSDSDRDMFKIDEDNDDRASKKMKLEFPLQKIIIQNSSFPEKTEDRMENVKSFSIALPPYSKEESNFGQPKLPEKYFNVKHEIGSTLL